MSAGKAGKLMRFSLLGALAACFFGMLLRHSSTAVTVCVVIAVILSVCFVVARFFWKCSHCGFLLPARGTWLWITRCPCCGEVLEDMGE